MKHAMDVADGLWGQGLSGPLSFLQAVVEPLNHMGRQGVQLDRTKGWLQIGFHRGAVRVQSSGLDAP